MRQCHDATATKERFFAQQGEQIAACAQAMARAFDLGARLLAMGNGGSSCDALHIAVEFTSTPSSTAAKLPPAFTLTADTALLTAIGNRSGFFHGVRPAVAACRANEAISPWGFPPSGKSANVNRALQTAREMNMLTVGFVGRDGGRMPALCDFCFLVPSFSLPRIQETHGTLLHILWDLVHVIRGEEDVL